MNQKRDHAAVLREVYRDLVLSLGTILSVRWRTIPEEVVAEICRCLRSLHRRHCTRYAAPVQDGPPGGHVSPHPEFLRLLKELESAT